MIIPNAEPFLIPGNQIGILLIHGFTGTPKEFREMGEALAEHGYSVLAPRLFGHATKIEDLNRARWMDWINSVEDGFHLLRGLTNKIIIVGLSMGGILSIVFASRRKVDGLIAISTPYELPPDPRAKLLPILWPFISQMPKGEPDWVDPTPAEDHIDYVTYPTRAILELNSLLKEMRDVLPTISVPTLLIHSLKDGAVPYSHMQTIAAKIGSTNLTTVTLDNSGHVVTRDLQKEKAFHESASFIRKICGNIS